MLKSLRGLYSLYHRVNIVISKLISKNPLCKRVTKLLSQHTRWFFLSSRKKVSLLLIGVAALESTKRNDFWKNLSSLFVRWLRNERRKSRFKRVSRILIACKHGIRAFPRPRNPPFGLCVETLYGIARMTRGARLRVTIRS